CRTIRGFACNAMQLPCMLLACLIAGRLTGTAIFTVEAKRNITIYNTANVMIHITRFMGTSSFLTLAPF
ncbi:MAG: hypothetical protein V2A77_02640, partial [Pseudomonadota bacterium]